MNDEIVNRVLNNDSDENSGGDSTSESDNAYENPANKELDQVGGTVTIGGAFLWWLINGAYSQSITVPFGFEAWQVALVSFGMLICIVLVRKSPITDDAKRSLLAAIAILGGAIFVAGTVLLTSALTVSLVGMIAGGIT